MQQNYHLDIETGGVNVGSAVFSIAVCVDTDQAVCHVHLPITLMVKMGYNVENETMIWHETKNPNWEALRTAITECPQSLSYLYQQLDKVVDYFNATALPDHDKRVWMKSPAFDRVLLKPVFDEVGMELPWTYKEEADVRTLFDLALEKCPDCSMPKPPENAHDALADAQYQMELTSACRSILL